MAAKSAKRRKVGAGWRDEVSGGTPGRIRRRRVLPKPSVLGWLNTRKPRETDDNERGLVVGGLVRKPRTKAIWSGNPDESRTQRRTG